MVHGRSLFLRLTSSLLVTCLLIAPGFSAPDTWFQVVSPHFTVVSNGDVETARDTAFRFEQIRNAFQKALPLARTDPGQPILILAARDEATIRELLPQFWEESGSAKPAGVFLTGPERHFVVVRTDVSSSTEYRPLYHEYFHLLLSLNAARVPLWLNEGLAEFYSQTTIAPRAISVGLPNEAHLARLRSEEMIPLETLFHVEKASSYYREADKASIFYSQSWALTHYLMTAAPALDGKSPVDRLLALLQEGKTAEQATRQALGLSYRLQDALGDYVHREEFKFFTYAVPPEASIPLQVVPLSEPSELSLRAAFLIRNDQTQAARKMISRALSLNPNEAGAYESLGILLYRQQRLPEALEAFEKAVDLGSQSYLSHYLFAVLSLSIGHKTVVSDSLIEQSLQKSIQLRPAFALPYATLAGLYLQSNKNLDTALELVMTACRLEPTRVHFLQVMGEILLALDRQERVKEVLSQMRQIATSGEDYHMIRELSRRLRERERNRSSWSYEFSLGGSQQGQPLPADQIREVPVRLLSARCEDPAILRLRVDEGGKELSVVSWDYALVEYILLEESGEFDPCRDIEGRSATLRIFDDGQGGELQLLGLRLDRSP